MLMTQLIMQKNKCRTCLRRLIFIIWISTKCQQQNISALFNRAVPNSRFYYSAN